MLPPALRPTRSSRNYTAYDIQLMAQPNKYETFHNYYEAELRQYDSETLNRGIKHFYDELTSAIGRLPWKQSQKIVLMVADEFKRIHREGDGDPEYEWVKNAELAIRAAVTKAEHS